MSDPTQPLSSKLVPAFSRDRWHDVIAGLSVAGLLLPQSLAYASIANMPPEAGIIALFAGLIFYGIFGLSRFAIVSATSSSAIVLAAATASMSNGNLALQLALSAGLVIITGVIFLIAGLTKTGNITDFIAKPVLRGFTFGLVIVIIVQQCADIVGIKAMPGSLFDLLMSLITQFDNWHQGSVITAAIALAILFFFERYKWLPGGVIVVLLGIAGSLWMDLSAHGIQLIGSIDLQLTTPSIPKISNAEWLQLSEVAFGLAFILYAESYGSIRSFAMKHGDSVHPNRDLLALGACNIASGLFNGVPVGAGYSATAANERHGARSRLAGLAAVVILLPIVLTQLHLIALIPKPVLAAIVIHAVSHSLTLATFRPYFAWRRDHIVIVAAVLAVLTLGVLEGLLVAVGISLFLMLRQMSAATVSELGRHGRREHDFVNLQTFPEASQIPGIIIVRPDQKLFFANADRITIRLREMIAATDPSVHAVVLSLEETSDLDSVTIEALGNLASYIEGTGKRLVLARVKDAAYAVLKHSIIPIMPNIGISRLSVSHAVNLALSPNMDEHADTDDTRPAK